MVLDWVVQNTRQALLLVRRYEKTMQDKGILSTAIWADGVARDIEDKLACRKAFPAYRPELENMLVKP